LTLPEESCDRKITDSLSSIISNPEEGARRISSDRRHIDSVIKHCPGSGSLRCFQMMRIGEMSELLCEDFSSSATEYGFCFNPRVKA